MSSPNLSAQGENGNQGAAFTSQFLFDTDNMSGQIDPSLAEADSNGDGSDFFSNRGSQGIAQLPVSGYANNMGSGYMGNIQAGFVPRTPGSLTKYQLSGNENNAFTSRPHLKYSSSSQNNNNASYTPRQQPKNKPSVPGNFGPQNPNSFPSLMPHSQSLPNMSQNLFSPTMDFGQSANHTGAGSPAPRRPDFNFEGPAVPRFQSSRGMHTSLGTDMATTPKPNQGRQSYSVKGNSYAPNDGFNFNQESDDFTLVSSSPFSLSDFQEPNKLWSASGNINQGFGNMHTKSLKQLVKHDKSGPNNGDYSVGKAPYYGQNQPSRQSELHPMHAQYAVNYDNDEDEGENANDHEESDDEAPSGTPSASRPAATIPGPVASRYAKIIKSEADFKERSTDRIREIEALLSKKSVKKTFPISEKDKLACIQRLFDAIMNTVDIEDKPSHDGRKAQAARRLDEDYYPAEMIEYACWEVFSKCKNASLGVTLVAVHHKAKHEGRGEHGNFIERWDAIVKACLNSKAVCKQILDPSYIDRLVDAPIAQFKMKLNNKKINAERDKQNKIGRLAIIAGVGADDLPFMAKKEEEGDDSVVTPSKRSGPRLRPSSNKRQAPVQAKFGYAYDDEDDDDEEDGSVYETPVKTNQAHAMSVSSRSMLTPHKPTRTPMKRVASSSVKAGKASPISDPLTELRTKYSKAICSLLHVETDNATTYSLEELRFFARVYNGNLSGEVWYDESFIKGEYGLGHRVFTSIKGNNEHYHFCFIGDSMQRFASLAIQRGELFPDGSRNTKHDPNYYRVDRPEMMQVLGLAPNAFGMVDYSRQPRQAK